MKREANAAYVYKDPKLWENVGWTSVPNAITRDPDIPPDECWAWTWLASFSEEFKVSGRLLWEAKRSLGRNRAYQLLSALERRGLLLRFHAYDPVARVSYIRYELQPTPVPEERRTWEPSQTSGRKRGPHPGSKAAREVSAEVPDQRIPALVETRRSDDTDPGSPGIPDQRIPDRAGETPDSRQGGTRQAGSPYKEDKTSGKEQNLGGLLSPVGHPREDSPPTAPPPHLSVNLEDRSTWMCREHLAALADAPGADRPACGKCARVREWAERKVTDRDQANAAARAALRDQCTMHDPAGWRLDPDTSTPLEPAVKCDHATPTAAVLADLASKAVPEPPSASDGTRAAAVASFRAACCPKPGRTPRKLQPPRPDRDLIATNTGSFPCSGLTYPPPRTSPS